MQGAIARARAWLLGVVVGAAVLGVGLCAAAVVASAGADGASHTAQRPQAPAALEPALPRAHPQVVEPEAGVVDPGPPTAPPAAAKTRDPRPNDAQIRRELRRLKALSARTMLPRGTAGRVAHDGQATSPAGAPDVVRAVVRAGNVIARTPYLWGGGHGSWSAVGYDCSGSVSFALAGAGLLGSPLTSGSLAGWGAPGPGRWITLYANASHVFMVVAGMRFDTGGLRDNGTRWQPSARSAAGFTARHPPGL